MTVDDILISTEQPIYYAGEVVRGELTVTVKQATNADDIEVNFSGTSSVQWKEEKSSSETKKDNESASGIYSSVLEVISLSTKLPVKDGYLDEGIHILPFDFNLPVTLPTSFEFNNSEGFAFIRYKVSAAIPNNSLISKLFSKSFSHPLSILQPVDTNSAQYAFCVSAKDEKSLCCLCCKSGPLEIDCKTDRAAYCPGETMALDAYFVNNSKRRVKPYARIVQQVFLYADGNFKMIPKSWPMTMTGEFAEEVSEMDFSHWNGLSFEIPHCFPSIKYDNVEVSYYVEVAMDIPYALNLRVSLPIVIGTIEHNGEPVVVTSQVLPNSESYEWSGVAGVDVDVVSPPIESNRNADSLQNPPPHNLQEMLVENTKLSASSADKKGMEDSEETEDKKTL